jgi:hypothetical protein
MIKCPMVALGIESIHLDDCVLRSSESCSEVTILGLNMHWFLFVVLCVLPTTHLLGSNMRLSCYVYYDSRLGHRHHVHRSSRHDCERLLYTVELQNQDCEIREM